MLWFAFLTSAAMAEDDPHQQWKKMYTTCLVAHDAGDYDKGITIAKYATTAALLLYTEK